jgi:hypothetical protein
MIAPPTTVTPEEARSLAAALARPSRAKCDSMMGRARCMPPIFRCIDSRP